MTVAAHIDELDFRELPRFPTLADIEPFELFSLSLSNDTTLYTHGLHRFPAKFVPQVPAWALRELAPADAVVLDPFSGSGTTLVESAVAGLEAVGLDLDPLAQMVAHAKVHPPSPTELRRLAAQLLDWRPAPLPSDLPMSGVDNPEHWFAAPTLRDLAGLRAAIAVLRCSEEARRFLTVVFSSILRRVSNADDQSQKTYVSGTRPKAPPAVRPTFARFLERAIQMAAAYAAAGANPESVRALEGDARQMPVPDRSVDLIVTSPPYLDSVDYMYNFMAEYFWLGPQLGVPDRASFNLRRRQSVGAKTPLGNPDGYEPELKGVIDLARVAEPRRRAVSAYLLDMGEHFRDAARCVRKGGHYVLVVGNSQTRDLPVPVHDALLRVAAASGFELETAFAYRIRRHYMKFPRSGRGGIILLDWVLVLRHVGAPVRPPAQLPLPHVGLKPADVAN
jgi:SAM-dependent methyltransferase